MCVSRTYAALPMPTLAKATELAFAGKLKEARKALGEPDTYEGRWLQAYIHNCFGEFEEALLLAMEVAQDSRDGELASKALVTAASTLRQTNRHLAARPLDESALRLAPDDAIATHALIGLAADAAGLGRERECGEHIDAAATRAAAGDWRARVRLAWVRCEHAMIAGRPRKAATHARDALDRSRAAKARRHEAKSLLFLAFSLRDAGDLAWKTNMKLAGDIATRIGALPIAEVARNASAAVG